jgi:hypothetical protein
VKRKTKIIFSNPNFPVVQPVAQTILVLTHLTETATMLNLHISKDTDGLGEYQIAS